jgi:hypothetical protein
LVGENQMGKLFKSHIFWKNKIIWLMNEIICKQNF